MQNLARKTNPPRDAWGGNKTDCFLIRLDLHQITNPTPKKRASNCPPLQALSFPNPTIHRLTGGGNLPDGSADWIMADIGGYGSQVARGQRRSKRTLRSKQVQTPLFLEGPSWFLDLLYIIYFLPLLYIYHYWWTITFRGWWARGVLHHRNETHSFDFVSMTILRRSARIPRVLCSHIFTISISKFNIQHIQVQTQYKGNRIQKVIGSRIQPKKKS